MGFGPAYEVSYKDKLVFSDASYSSIEILVYEGPIQTGKKLAYAHAVSIGSQDATFLSIINFMCIDSLPGNWNFNCEGM